MNYLKKKCRTAFGHTNSKQRQREKTEKTEMVPSSAKTEEVETDNELDRELQPQQQQQEGKRRQGTWKHAAFHVATTIATPAAYAPLPFALASLGWPFGIFLFLFFPPLLASL